MAQLSFSAADIVGSFASVKKEGSSATVIFRRLPHNLKGKAITGICNPSDTVELQLDGEAWQTLAKELSTAGVINARVVRSEAHGLCTNEDFLNDPELMGETFSPAAPPPSGESDEVLRLKKEIADLKELARQRDLASQIARYKQQLASPPFPNGGPPALAFPRIPNVNSEHQYFRYFLRY